MTHDDSKQPWVLITNHMFYGQPRLQINFKLRFPVVVCMPQRFEQTCLRCILNFTDFMHHVTCQCKNTQSVRNNFSFNMLDMLGVNVYLELDMLSVEFFLCLKNNPPPHQRRKIMKGRFIRIVQNT